MVHSLIIITMIRHVSYTESCELSIDYLSAGRMRPIYFITTIFNIILVDTPLYVYIKGTSNLYTCKFKHNIIHVNNTIRKNKKNYVKKRYLKR